MKLSDFTTKTLSHRASKRDTLIEGHLIVNSKCINSNSL